MTNQPTKWWPSPAKLNLFLHITGRNENGYHLLQSLFQLVDMGDELAFRTNKTGKINLLAGIEGVAQQDNLIVKAAELLKKQSNSDFGCDIWLKKVLPMGGGIGGGSSNAATTLLVLNKMLNLGFSHQQLAELGLKLGADVPIFVHGHTAFAQGIGEVISPVSMPKKCS